MMNNLLYEKTLKEPDYEFDNAVSVMLTSENNGYIVWRDNGFGPLDILFWTPLRNEAIEFAVKAQLDTPALTVPSTSNATDPIEVFDKLKEEAKRKRKAIDGEMSKAYTFHIQDNTHALNRHAALGIHHDFSGSLSTFYKERLRSELHITPEEMRKFLTRMKAMIDLEMLFEEGGYVTSLEIGPTDMTDENRRHAQSKDGN